MSFEESLNKKQLNSEFALILMVTFSEELMDGGQCCSSSWPQGRWRTGTSEWLPRAAHWNLFTPHGAETGFSTGASPGCPFLFVAACCCLVKLSSHSHDWSWPSTSPLAALTWALFLALTEKPVQKFISNWEKQEVWCPFNFCQQWFL